MNDEKWLELAFGDPDKANELKQKEDGTFDYSNEFKTNQQTINTEIENRKNNLVSAKQKLLDLGLTEAEVKALIGV